MKESWKIWRKEEEYEIDNEEDIETEEETEHMEEKELTEAAEGEMEEKIVEEIIKENEIEGKRRMCLTCVQHPCTCLLKRIEERLKEVKEGKPETKEYGKVEDRKRKRSVSKNIINTNKSQVTQMGEIDTKNATVLAKLGKKPKIEDENNPNPFPSNQTNSKPEFILVRAPPGNPLLGPSPHRGSMCGVGLDGGRAGAGGPPQAPPKVQKLADRTTAASDRTPQTEKNILQLKPPKKTDQPKIKCKKWSQKQQPKIQKKTK